MWLIHFEHPPGNFSIREAEPLSSSAALSRQMHADVARLPHRRSEPLPPDWPHPLEPTDYDPGTLPCDIPAGRWLVALVRTQAQAQKLAELYQQADLGPLPWSSEAIQRLNTAMQQFQDWLPEPGGA